MFVSDSGLDLLQQRGHNVGLDSNHHHITAAHHLGVAACGPCPKLLQCHKDIGCSYAQEGNFGLWMYKALLSLWDGLLPCVG